MAYRKASEESAAVALGSVDFWAAVQGGKDVRVSVGDILVYLRTVLKISDVSELRGILDGIISKASGDTTALAAEMHAALGNLDGSVKSKLDTITIDINTRATKAQLGNVAGLNTGTGAGNIPVLDGFGKLNTTILPALAITDTFPVASQVAMLAVDAERGDIAIRSDLNRCYVLKAEPASTLANWVELLTPTDAVLAVAGLTGAITASALKVALGIAIGDVSGLQAALNALTSADGQLRTDMNSGLAGKFDKTGGAISGGVTATGTVQGNALTAQSAADAMVQIESTAAADTTYRRKQILSSVNIGGGNDWLFRMVRPSDNAIQDFYLKSGTGGNIWTTGNFDPSTKASLNASVSFAALTTTGDANINGAVNFGARLGQLISLYGGSYGIGIQNSTAYVRTGTEFAVHAGGVHASAQGDPGGGVNLMRLSSDLFTYKGQTIWHAGTFNPDAKANLAGAAFTGTISAPIIALPGTGNNWFEAGTGDAANYTTYNTKMRVHWSLAIADYAGNVQGFYNAREGFWDTKGAPRVNGQNVWYPGNFDPASKASLTGAAFTGAINATYIAVPRTPTLGGINLNPGSATNTGYVEFWPAGSGVRHGYIGFSDGANINLSAEVGRFNFIGNEPTVGSQRIWHAGSFNPVNYAALTGAGFSGNVTAPYVGTPQLNVTGSTGTLVLNGRDGGVPSLLYQTSGVFRVYMSGEDKLRVQSDGNIWTPLFGWLGDKLNTKIDYGSSTRLSSTNIGSGEALVYSDGNSHNLRFRVGTNANGYKYAGFNEDGTFQNFSGGFRGGAFVGDSFEAKGPVTVGSGQTSSSITMCDTDEGNRTIHNNSSTIGFLGSGGDWVLRVNDAGEVTTKQLGDLKNWIENRASAWARQEGSSYYEARSPIRANVGGRQDMQGPLSVQSYMDIVYPGVLRARWKVESNGQTNLQNGDDGTQFVSIGRDGAIWTKQFGDLNNRIEDRINAKSIRMTFAADLDNNWNNNGGMVEPYTGAVMTTRRVTNNVVDAFRFRYLQMSTSNGDWYTCTF